MHPTNNRSAVPAGELSIMCFERLKLKAIQYGQFTLGTLNFSLPVQLLMLLQNWLYA